MRKMSSPPPPFPSLLPDAESPPFFDVALRGQGRDFDMLFMKVDSLLFYLAACNIVEPSFSFFSSKDFEVTLMV